MSLSPLSEKMRPQHLQDVEGQDIFLPYMENGSIILIGATTENPSFALNAALLSRLRILILNPLSENALNNILSRCLKQLPTLVLSDEVQTALIHLSQADARHL